MMKRFCAIVLLLTAVALLGSVDAIAKDVHKKAGTSGFPFLKISIGARAVAMGGAFTGLADDASAMYYNPAGLASISGRQFILGYHNYFVDIQSGFGGVTWDLNEKAGLGIFVDYLNYGEFTETDTQGDRTGQTFGGGDVMLGASYARKVNYHVQVGATAKFIYEKLDDYSATGAAVDLGVKYVDNRERLGLGLTIQNLGAQLSSLGRQKDDLPMMLRGGLSYKPMGLNMTLTSDVIVPFDNDLDVAIGLEYHELKPFYIRAGWTSFGANYKVAGSGSSWSGFAVGVGFDIKDKYHIGYAIQGAAELGETHRITFSGIL